ncbi:MAG: iron ABC transporter permease [Clostridiales bacterium]|jgi:iron complex transport system permease protein|nr:iron ABC transporter permease [Clostridiales bacterium]
MKKIETKRPYRIIIIILFAVLLAAVIGSIALGRYPIRLKETLGILGSKVFEIKPFWSATQESLLLNHRLPRIIVACLVGCCLSAAGASYQGVFQNPMAAPDILGASSGAAFGAALAILLDLGGVMTVIFAFCCSILVVLLVIYTGSRAKGKRVLGLILSGIMISSLVSSGTSFIKLVADPEDQLPAITYWLMGSLNGTSPRDVAFAFFPMFAGLIPLLLLRWRINILTLGDEEAATMGVNAKRLRMAVIICATLVTAASVSVSGMIGWVGLVIPHISRRLTGNNYKHLLPASMLFGAIFLLLVDDVSRNLLTTEIPIGILTSLIGAPFFIYLISKDGEQL